MDKKRSDSERLRKKATQEVSHRLGRPLADIPEFVWRHALKQEEVSNALKDPDPNCGLADLVDYLAPLCRYEFARQEFQRTARRGRLRHQEPESPDSEYESLVKVGTDLVQLNDEEQERGEALTDFFSKIAAAQPGVRGFRKRILEEKLLTAGEADEFVNSPAIRFLTIEEFRSAGISFTRHKASIQNAVRVDRSANRAFRKTGISSFEDIATAVEEKKGPGHRKLEILVTPIENAPQQSIEITVTHDEEKEMRWLDSSGRTERLTYQQGSILDLLTTTVVPQLKSLNWQEAQAVKFVLTGTAPPLWPIDVTVRQLWGYLGAHDYDQGFITMTAQTWVSADSIAQTYRKVQEQMTGTKSARYSYRPLTSRRRLALFRFITEQMEIVPDKEGQNFAKFPSFPELVKLWNQRCSDPRWRYGLSNSHHLWRDYSETLDALTSNAAGYFDLVERLSRRSAKGQE